MGKFLRIGLNYADHAAEAGLPVPCEPIVFMKPPHVAAGCDHAVVLPRGSVKTDWKVALWLDVNGCRWQDGNIRTMVVDVAELVNGLSKSTPGTRR